MESLSTRELVKRELADKQLDEKGIELISGAIDEFDDTFGKYVNKQELMRRLKEYLKCIKFKTELPRNILGNFNGETKEISILETLSEQEMKSVFFHEFVHCIRYNPQMETCGFEEKYESYDEDGSVYYIGRGLDEGFTQHVTRIRDEKYFPEKSIIAYPILSEQVGNLAELIGEDRFLDIGFNNPQELPHEIGDINQFEYDNFLENFDVIWDKEKDIYEKTKKGQFFNIIFGLNAWNGDSRRLINAKQEIINMFQKIMLEKHIRTIDEFNNMYNKISQYCEQLGSPLSPKILRELLPKIDELQNTGLNIEEILNGIDEEYATFFKANEFVNRFKKLSSKEKIEVIISDDEFKDWSEDLYNIQKYYDNFGEDLIIELSNSVIQTNSDEESLGLFYFLEVGLAQYIKANGYNLDKLAVEYIDFESNDLFGKNRKIFNLYDTDFDKRTYLGTFGLDYDFTEMYEYRQILDGEDLRPKYPQLKDGIITMSENGEIIADMGDGKYILIDEYGDELSNEGETSYSPSKLERLQDKVLNRVERLKRLKELNAPQILLENEEQMLQEIVQEMSEICGDKKITPSQISEATQDISMQEIYQVLEEIANAKSKREETELGIRGKGEEIGD